METIIKLTPSELNASLLKKIKKLIGNKENVDVTISVKEYNAEYARELNDSIEQSESGHDLVNFTMEEFMAYKLAKCKQHQRFRYA